MKKLLLSTMVLGSTVALSACGGTSSDADLDGTISQPPYAEERTVGTTGGNVVVSAPSGSTVSGGANVSTGTTSGDTIVRSAEPVFESSQVK